MPSKGGRKDEGVLEVASKSTVRIHQGDCVEFMRTLPDGSVDAVITDPPYLVGYKGKWTNRKEEIAGDSNCMWVYPAYAEMYRVLKDDSFLVTFYGWPHSDVFVSTFKELELRIVSQIVFVKNVWGLGTFTRGQHEQAFLLAKGKPKLTHPPISDVIHWDRDHNAKHPNQKPHKVMAALVKNYAPAAGVVLDPFMGSGSTGVACVKAGVDFIGCEIDPKHFATAKRRIDEANTTLF